MSYMVFMVDYNLNIAQTCIQHTKFIKMDNTNVQLLHFMLQKLYSVL